MKLEQYKSFNVDFFRFDEQKKIRFKRHSQLITANDERLSHLKDRAPIFKREFL